jgi:hypothetical protein
MVNAPYTTTTTTTNAAGLGRLMMNKSLRGGGRESSSKPDYGFRRVRRIGHAPSRQIFSGHSWGYDMRKKRAAVSGGF